MRRLQPRLQLRRAWSLLLLHSPNQPRPRCFEESAEAIEGLSLSLRAARDLLTPTPLRSSSRSELTELCVCACDLLLIQDPSPPSMSRPAKAAPVAAAAAASSSSSAAAAAPASTAFDLTKAHFHTLFHADSSITLRSFVLLSNGADVLCIKATIGRQFGAAVMDHQPCVYKFNLRRPHGQSKQARDAMQIWWFATLR